MIPPRKPPEHDATMVRDISTAVYKQRLGDDADAMVAKVGEAKVRDRAPSYDAITRAYLRVLKVQIGVAA